ncbi:MAG: BMP family protein [Exilispira sp.]
MKRIFILVILIIFVIFIILFENFFAKIYKASFQKYKIGFVVSDIGDKGFADMQLEGVKKASKIYKTKYKLFITKSFDKIKDGIISAIDEGCNIIICGNGFLAEKQVLELAPLYPQNYFIIMDTILKNYPDNVATVSFKQNEGSFLAGIIAGKITKSKKIGFIGGMNIPVINDFLVGFIQGVGFVDNSIKVISKFVEDLKVSNPFQSIEGGYKIASSLIEKDKVDIIYAVSGETNLGIFNALKDRIIDNQKIFAIGVDTDQDGLLEGQILTSMIKNLDTAVIYIIDKIINKNFENKNFRIGLKENGVGLTEMKYTKDIISKDLLNLLDQIKQNIIEGKIIVDSVYN